MAEDAVPTVPEVPPCVPEPPDEPELWLPDPLVPEEPLVEVLTVLPEPLSPVDPLDPEEVKVPAVETPLEVPMVAVAPEEPELPLLEPEEAVEWEAPLAELAVDVLETPELAVAIKPLPPDDPLEALVLATTVTVTPAEGRLVCPAASVEVAVRVVEPVPVTVTVVVQVPFAPTVAVPTCTPPANTSMVVPGTPVPLTGKD